MKLFKSLVSWGKAKDTELANKLEEKHEVEFAQQDLEAMERDLAAAIKALGDIKARLMGMERDIKEKETEITDRTDKARQLKAKEMTDLALKQCAIIEDVTATVEVLRNSYTDLKAHYEAQLENKNKLQSSVEEARRSIKLMKTMRDVAQSNESLTTIKVGGASSALEKFQARKKRLQERLDSSKAILDEQSSGDRLDEETEKALGNQKGSSLFDSL